MVNRNRWYQVLFTLYAPAYDLLAARFNRARIRAIHRLDCQPGMSVLLAGCGTGIELDFMAPGSEIWLADLSQAMLDRAVRRAEKQGFPCHSTRSDLTSLPFSDGQFDRVILHFTLTLLPDPERTWNEIYRILRPGGMVSVLDWFGPFPLPAWLRDASSLTGWTQGIVPEKVLPGDERWEYQVMDRNGPVHSYRVVRVG